MTPAETAVIEAARRLFTAEPMSRAERVATLRTAVQAYENGAVAAAMEDPLETRFIAALDALGASRARTLFLDRKITVEQLADMEYWEVLDIRQAGPVTIDYWLATLVRLGLLVRWADARNADKPRWADAHDAN